MACIATSVLISYGTPPRASSRDLDATPNPASFAHDSGFAYECKSPTRGRSNPRRQLNQRESRSNRWRTDGNVRVGREDSNYPGKGALAKTNADQVRRIRSILKNLSLEFVTPDEARAMLQRGVPALRPSVPSSRSP